MIRRRIYRSLIVAAVAMFSLCAGGAASAGDCFRQMGLGYSAGYHAPAPLVHTPTLAKTPGWLCWKGACCHPGTPAAGCGCGVAAPVPCAPCAPPAPCCGAPCGVPCCGPGLFGLLNHCGVKNPGVY
jgi:hypothetical protein